MITLSHIMPLKTKIIIRCILVLFTSVLPFTHAKLQTIEHSVITPYGSQYDNNFQILQYTVGEPAVVTLTDSTSFYLTQGFQQPSSSELTQTDYLIRLDIYPNPVSDKVNIRFYVKDIDDFVIEVYDIIGNLVLNAEVSDVFSGQVESLDLTKLRQGIYMIKVHADKDKMKLIEKIVKL